MIKTPLNLLLIIATKLQKRAIGWEIQGEKDITNTTLRFNHQHLDDLLSASNFHKKLTSQVNQSIAILNQFLVSQQARYESSNASQQKLFEDSKVN